METLTKRLITRYLPMQTTLQKIANHLKIRFAIKEFAERLDYSPGTVSDYYNGKKELSHNFKQKLETAYGIKFEYFEEKNEEDEKVIESIDLVKGQLLESRRNLNTLKELVLQQAEVFAKYETTDLRNRTDKRLNTLYENMNSIDESFGKFKREVNKKLNVAQRKSA